MAGFAWTGRFDLNLLEEASRKASNLDEACSNQIDGLLLGAALGVFIRLRAYLQHHANEMDARNDVATLIKMTKDHSGLVLITLGPQFDSGLTPAHFRFDSGARLSFGIALRPGIGASFLVSFRFHLHFAGGQIPEFLRFDLNREKHAVPLSEPRCHLHPGMNEVRLPLPVMDVFEILDRIFFVIEPTLEAPSG